MGPSLLLSLGAFLTPPICKQQASGGRWADQEVSVHSILHLSWRCHCQCFVWMISAISLPGPAKFESQHWFRLPVASIITEALTQHWGENIVSLSIWSVFTGSYRFIHPPKWHSIKANNLSEFKKEGKRLKHISLSFVLFVLFTYNMSCASSHTPAVHICPLTQWWCTWKARVIPTSSQAPHGFGVRVSCAAEKASVEMYAWWIMEREGKAEEPETWRGAVLIFPQISYVCQEH